eukprot:jgi/Hompol1/1683/HPOL_004709-RA
MASELAPYREKYSEAALQQEIKSISESYSQRLAQFEQSESAKFEAQKLEITKKYEVLLEEVKAQHEAKHQKIKSDMVSQLDAAQKQAKERVEKEIRRIQAETFGSSTASNANLADASSPKRAPRLGSEEYSSAAATGSFSSLSEIDSPLRKKRADFEREFNVMRDKLNMEYRVKEEELKARVQEEHRAMLEQAAAEMREQAKKRNDDVLRKLKTSLEEESQVAVTSKTNLSELQAKEDLLRADVEKRIENLKETLRRKEQEIAEAEKQLAENYDKAQREWQSKLSKLNEEMRNAESAARNKLSAESLKQVDSSRNDTDKLLQDERQRRQRLDMLLNDMVQQERDARNRLDSVLQDLAQQESAARAKNDVIRNELAKVERDLASKLVLLKHDLELKEREQREVETILEKLQAESRELKQRASSKRQAVVELGPLEQDIDQRRQALLKERMQIEDMETEINVRRKRLEDEKFTLGLAEKEILLLRRQLDDEKRALEIAQAELVAERRNLSMIRATATMVADSSRYPGNLSASPRLRGDSRMSYHSAAHQRDHYTEHPVRDVDAGFHVASSKKPRKKHSKESNKSNVSDIRDTEEENAARNPASIAKDVDSDSGDVEEQLSDQPLNDDALSVSNDSDSGQSDSKTALARLRARILREERELQKAKQFLKSHRKDINQRITDIEASRTAWDIPRLPSTVSGFLMRYYTTVAAIYNCLGIG